MAKNKASQAREADAKAIVTPGKGTKKTFSTKLGKEKFGLEEFCNYKSLLAMEVLGEMGGKIDLRTLINAFMAMRQGEDKEVVGAILLVNLLPPLFKEAPHSILKLASLCLISNQKLSELYDEPNGIATEIQRIEKLIGFKGEPGLPIIVIKEALPYIGIDFLKNAWAGLGSELEELLPVEEQPPSTG